MNHNNYYALFIIASLIAYEALSAMNDNDPLWDTGKIVAVSPKPSPSKYFALHDLIQSPDILTMTIEEIRNKVAKLLAQYPRYLTITNRQEQTAFDLLGLQLARTDLSDGARSNFIGLKEFLESHKKS